MTGTGRYLSPATGPGLLMNWLMAGIKQYGTHRALTGQAGDAQHSRLPLDAIIVPGTRPAAYLDHAVTLAKAVGCQLLILCSQQLDRAAVDKYLAARSLSKAIVINLPEGYRHELLTFPALESISTELPPEYALYATDLSMKRNLGLVLAKMLRWRRVFFLDDDIRDIAPADLQATVGMLESFSAAGMWVTDFPDNSIVCHANRMTEGSQDVFVSGAALAVDCTRDIGFFPDIYNEDWLFFFDNVAGKRLANSGLPATQLTYYPFANPQRAAWQEFGDVLAEGLYALLHRDGKVEYATTSEYWKRFLEARRTFLENILTRTQKADERVRDDMAVSVEAALKCLLQIKPDLCARYVQSWRIDLDEWKRRLAAMPVMSSVEEALAKLRLTPTAPADDVWKVMPDWAVPMPALIAGPAALPQLDTLDQLSTHDGVQQISVPPAAMRDTKPLPALADEAPRRRRLRGHGLIARWGIIRNNDSLAHQPAAEAGSSPGTLEPHALEGASGPALRDSRGAEELTLFLTDTCSLHTRHSVADCYSAAYFPGEGQLPSLRA